MRLRLRLRCGDGDGYEDGNEFGLSVGRGSGPIYRDLSSFNESINLFSSSSSFVFSTTGVAQSSYLAGHINLTWEMGIPNIFKGR